MTSRHDPRFICGNLRNLRTYPLPICVHLCLISFLLFRLRRYLHPFRHIPRSFARPFAATVFSD
jgi:hypothetical protein